ncbi:MAG: TrbI/VirB10 family protein [Treponema sp.]|jgi:type IV secretory pathway VirB10-like protein|nr:TrbI/VirB10 family protein [Treponema sp.]
MPDPETLTDDAEQRQYEMSAEEATGLDAVPAAAGFFNRKKVTMILSVSLALVVGGGFLFNAARETRRPGEDAAAGPAAARTPDFLRGERDRALSAAAAAEERLPDAGPPPPAEPSLPAVYPDDGPAGEFARPGAPQPAQPPAPVPPPARNEIPGAPPPVHDAYRSPLVPRTIEGSLFGTPRELPPPAPAEPYAPFPDQAAAGYTPRQFLAPPAAPPASPSAGDNAQPFFDPQGGGAVIGGDYLGGHSLWIGTLVPGVLETGINTDLPGNVIARVTQNIYDSRTGRELLIPQGSILVARYNNSVSFSQHRVQIVWDTLIRPDGYQIDLGGMNGVDRKGMAGLEAEYHENWFEYLKAAGIIMMFSVANARMTEEAAKHASGTAASGIAQGNAEFVNQMGGTIVSRAMNIQPTLSLDNGSRINIMLNKTVYLPPVPDYPVTKKYSLR